jgi:hypothetical protein
LSGATSPASSWLVSGFITFITSTCSCMCF